MQCTVVRRVLDRHPNAHVLLMIIGLRGHRIGTNTIYFADEEVSTKRSTTILLRNYY